MHLALSVRVQGATKNELFPNLDETDRTDSFRFPVCVSPLAEDQDAGYPGVPFTQPEHEEEWMGWIDWGNVGA